jgi:gamma-butyrobetaine dioxygenase
MPSQATRPPLVGMPAVWLRDNCPCPLCRDPVSGQRLLHITDIPPDIAVAEVVSSGRTVSVLFHPDGHRAVFDRDWLARHGEPAPGGLPGPGAVLAVAASLGYVRETNYGRLFDVRVENSPSNLAFTSLPVPPHTDNPYRDPVPTVQLPHCLRNAADGGDSGFVDGFPAAAALRVQDPAAFATLAVTPATFGYRDATTELSAIRPLISLDACGRIREIRINPRSLQPARLAGPRAAAFCAGYAAYAELLSAAPSMLTIRLRPGDCAVFGNTRVLHARTGFTQGGRRHLQGCYADLDGVESAVAVGERATTGVIRRKDRT